MTVPLQARDHETFGFSFATKDSFLIERPNTPLSSYVFFGGKQYVFSMMSSSEDISSGARKNAFSSFYNREQIVLANLVKKTYHESAYNLNLALSCSNLVGTHISLDPCIKKAGYLSRLKKFFLRILAILKKFFCIETKKDLETAKNNKDKRNLLLGVKAKLSGSKAIFKYSLVKTKPPLLVDRPTQTYLEDFLIDKSVRKEKKAFFLSLVLKDMWVKQETKDLSCYTWCMLTVLVKYLQEFYKFLYIDEKNLIPSSHITLLDELYLEWEQQIPSIEDLKIIVFSLLETLNGKIFSELLEQHGASRIFIRIAERFEDSLLPSQVRIVLALIAKHCMTFISSLARKEATLFLINHLELTNFIDKNLTLLSRIKKLHLVTWIGLMQILTNDALKD